jgi:hypothetical protein
MEEVEGKKRAGEGEEDRGEEKRGMRGGGRIREEEMRREKEIRRSGEEEGERRCETKTV